MEASFIAINIAYLLYVAATIPKRIIPLRFTSEERAIHQDRFASMSERDDAVIRWWAHDSVEALTRAEPTLGSALQNVFARELSRKVTNSSS